MSPQLFIDKGKKIEMFLNCIQILSIIDNKNFNFRG